MAIVLLLMRFQKIKSEQCNRRNHVHKHCVILSSLIKSLLAFYSLMVKKTTSIKSNLRKGYCTLYHRPAGHLSSALLLTLTLSA